MVIEIFLWVFGQQSEIIVTAKNVLFVENQFSWISWVNQTMNIWIQWSIFLLSIMQQH
jgi:hypothetical protein